MKYIFLLFTISSALFSCEYDYNIDKHFDREFVPKVVFNSIITPDSLIKGELFWSKSINDKSAYRKVDDFHVKLYENGDLIFDDKGSNGAIRTGIYPKVGSRYSILIDVDNYGQVRASTTIPSAVSTYTSTYDGEKKAVNSPHNAYQFYTIDNIITTQQSRALWIEAETEYADSVSQKAIYLYMESSFCDQINVIRGDDIDVSLRGSEMFHNLFIRIPYKNIRYTLPIKFSIRALIDRYGDKYTATDDFGNPILEKVKIPVIGVNLLLITPSDEYDKYHKSSYRQIYSGTISEIPIFNEPTSVYSNIDNGIGIFAGYRIEKQKHKVDRK